MDDDLGLGVSTNLIGCPSGNKREFKFAPWIWCFKCTWQHLPMTPVRIESSVLEVCHWAVFFWGRCNGVMDSVCDFDLLGELVPQVWVSARTLALRGFFHHYLFWLPSSFNLNTSSEGGALNCLTVALYIIHIKLHCNFNFLIRPQRLGYV